MQALADYSIIEQLSETKSAVVCRAKSTNNGKTVIIKVLNTDRPTPAEFARFRHEYELIKDLDIPGVVKTFELVESDTNVALILEDFNGLSLNKVLKKSISELGSFLNIAIDLADTLGQLHLAGVVHKDIKPSNILFNVDTKVVKFTDFGIASVLTRNKEALFSRDVIEGSLAYMSPEQTGRMTRGVDYRTDFYSLGMTFYEMLTGRVPFRSNDPMETIHSHIAVMPEAPSDIDSAIPRSISNIVMKLLDKNPEDRYQNAFGLKADLQECKRQYARGERISVFDLGRSDVPIKLNIPQKLYGRSAQLDLLSAIMAKVVGGQKGLVEIGGSAGVGKTALVEEMHTGVVESRGYFVTGRYEKLAQETPYSGIIKAFQNLVRYLLSDSKYRIQALKALLLDSLGPNGRVITDVIPEVELIIGAQPALPELSPSESQNRFNLTFINFTRVFAKREHPLVIFLDDAHWMDAASTQLLTRLFEDAEIESLLVIVAHRRSVVDKQRPGTADFAPVAEQADFEERLTIEPLTTADVRDLITETFRCPTAKAEQLAAIVHRKTNGNPFFVGQFVTRAHEENLLSLTRASGWNWDNDSIDKLDVTDNVVDLMAEKLSRLTPETLATLKICAVIGSRFELTMLSHLTGKTTPTLLSDLGEAIEEGLISSVDDHFEFRHDRVFDAAYSLVESDAREKLHLRIGRHLLDGFAAEELADRVFMVVNHWGRCLRLLDDTAERGRVASVHLLAGQRAKSSAAYAAALNYLKVGIDLLGDSSWSDQYQLTFSLYCEAVEASFLSTDYDEMDRLADQALAHTQSLLDDTRIYRIKIQTLIAQNRLSEAVDLGTSTLRRLGVGFPKRPRLHHVALSQLTARMALFTRTDESIREMPAATDPKKIAAMQVCGSFGSVAFLVNIKTWAIVSTKAFELALRNGYVSSSSYACVGYGAVQCALGNVDRGYRFGQQGLKLLAKTEDKEFETRSKFVFSCYIRHMKEHLGETLEPLLHSYQSGLETGDLEFSAFSLNVYTYHALHCGNNLAELNERTVEHLRLIGQLKQKPIYDMTAVYHQFILNLLGESDDPLKLVGSAYNEEEGKPLLLAQLSVLMLCIYFGKYDRAREAAAAVERKYRRLTGTSHLAVFFFFDSLVHLVLAEEDGDNARADHLKKVKKNQRQLERFAQSSPLNSAHKYALVQAESARISGNRETATECYQQAIEGAHRNGFIQDEALASELTARFYEQCGQQRNAEFYLDNAYCCYARWGARAKVRQLEKRHTRLRIRATRGPAVSLNGTEGVGGALTGTMSAGSTTTRTGSTTMALDFTTAIKAARVISSEIVLSKLLVKLMRLSMENAGAEKGLVILEEEGQLLIEAKSELGNDQVTVMDSTPVDLSEDLSPAIVNFVARTKETLLLGDASHQGDFVNDIYVLKHKPKSILCSPIINKGRLTGVLYFENNLTTNAFAAERLELLKILASQVSIAIENAKLYSSLADSNRELAAALQQAEESARVKSEFLANTSHELRTPLNAIINIPDGLVEEFREYHVAHCTACDELFEIEENEQLDPKGSCPAPSCGQVGTLVAETRWEFEGEQGETVSYLKSIAKAGRHLLAVVNDILDISKLEAGRMILYPEKIAIPELLTDVEASMRALVRGKCITLDFPTLEPGTEVFADRVKLSQILINLIGNAVKFSADGSSVEIGVDRRNEQITFSVRDQGVGIAEEAQQYVFDSFRQVDGGHTRHQGGTGLGLSITKKLVEMHEGEIWLESRLGEGTTFFVRMPCAGPSGVRSSIPPAVGNIDQQDTILVIDEDLTALETSALAIRKLGFKIVVSKESIDLIDRIEKLSPRLVIIADAVAGGSGIDVLQKIRRQESTREQSVLVLGTDQQNKSIAGRFGAHWISKPWTNSEMIELIKDIMQGRSGQRELDEENETV